MYLPSEVRIWRVRYNVSAQALSQLDDTGIKIVQCGFSFVKSKTSPSAFCSDNSAIWRGGCKSSPLFLVPSSAGRLTRPLVAAQYSAVDAAMTAINAPRIRNKSRRAPPFEEPLFIRLP